MKDLLGPKFGIVKSCEAIGLKQSTYYYKGIDWEERDRLYKEMAEEFLEVMPQSGYRSITSYINNTLFVNKKRIQRICQENNLQAVRKKRFRPTTDSNHNLRKHPDLLGERRISGDYTGVIVADITAFSTRSGDGFVAALTDLTNREIIGIAVSAHNNTELALAALEDARYKRSDLKNYIHHSDSDVRYCSEKYIDKLNELGLKISMCKGNAYENAHAESVNATFKRQEINANDYPNVAKGAESIIAFRDKHSMIRPHSSIGGRTPVQEGIRLGIYNVKNKLSYPLIHISTKKKEAKKKFAAIR